MSASAEGAEQGSWRLLGTRPPRCPFGAHRREAGLDESARRLPHSELSVAEMLVAEGHSVRAQPELPGKGRTADLDVCGQSVEVKTWLPPEARGGRAPTARSVFNKLSDARDQGATAVLWARGSGLSALDAGRGVEEFVATGRFGGMSAIRVVGDGFDLAWGHPGPELGPDGARGPSPSPPGPRSPRPRRPQPVQRGADLSLDGP